MPVVLRKPSPGITAATHRNGGHLSPGFGADHAISIENSSIGVYGLAAGGNGSLTLLFSQSQA